MLVYPKGCRFYAIRNGEISPRKKITQKTSINVLDHKAEYIVVQPRGWQRWMLFDTRAVSEPKMLLRGFNPTALCMAAVLGV